MGMKINNPWNLKCADRRDPWLGTQGYDAAGHVVFVDLAHAARAACRDLAQKYLGGRRTLHQIFERYSPETDTHGGIEGGERNNPAAIAFGVAQMANRRLGWTEYVPERDCNLFDPDGAPTNIHMLRNFLEVLAAWECGAGTELARLEVLDGVKMYFRDFVAGPAGAPDGAMAGEQDGIDERGETGRV